MVGLYIRLRVEETPVFTAHLEEKKLETAPVKLPFADAMRLQWKQIVISGLAMSTLFAMFYIGSTFLTSYGTGRLEFSRTMILGFGMIAALVLAAATAGAALLSDRIGRRKVIAGAYVGSFFWSLLLFPSSTPVLPSRSSSA